jgi:hypothetical protein
MNHRAPPRAISAAVAAAALSVTACGGTAVALQSVGLDLPAATSPKPLATTTTYTSPDGGIYRNPLHLDVLAVSRSKVDQLEQRLGTEQQWRPLTALGDFTLVAIRLRNDGKAWSEPDVADLQIASDFAPQQAKTGALHAFYHPTYPLAVVSDTAPGSQCRPHIDPGHQTTVVLVYPPIAVPSGGIVWGRYQEFALRVPQGGGVDSLTDHPVSAAACTHPQSP